MFFFNWLQNPRTCVKPLGHFSVIAVSQVPFDISEQPRQTVAWLTNPARFLPHVSRPAIMSGSLTA